MSDQLSSMHIRRKSIVNRLVGFIVFQSILLALPLSASLAQSDSESVHLRPNIILINLDDADYRMFSPELLELYPAMNQLVKRSISFTNLHVTTPFCGPSRASLFRGQYAHRTGVRVNIPESPLSLSFKGGYSEFLRQGHDQEELGVWMKRAGYRTMMVGKYHHNGFDFRVPPGWDDFYMSNGGRYTGTYRFTNQEDPQGSNSQNADDVYRTDQEADDAVRLIRSHVSSTSREKFEESSRRKSGSLVRQENETANRGPFFLYVAPLAPHRPVGADFTNMVDKTKYDRWQPDLSIPPTPDFDEPQMSDKPLHRQSPPYSQDELEVLQSEYLSRARAIKSVDDMVAKLLTALEEYKLTESTYVFFTSDNGYQLGQHRLHNKLDPYQMCTNVPLWVSGPGLQGGQSANHLLAHIDLCPTILELAGANIPELVDGKSFVPLLTDPESEIENDWRAPVVIENWQSKRNRGKVLPGAYSGLRFYASVYVEWVTGDKEFYDLKNDPFELQNIYSSLSDEQAIALKNELLNSRNVKMDPIATLIPGPIETDDDPNFVRGRAEDDRVISKVELTIQDSRTKQYWNGNSWVDGPIELAAELSSNDQQIISWRYAFQPLAETKLQVEAWATDESGNVSSKAIQSVTMGADNKN